MRIFVFRAGFQDDDGSPVDGNPSYLYSFGPIPDDASRGIIGSGPNAWKSVRVPYGTQVLRDHVTGQEWLQVPNEPSRLTPEEVIERFEE